MLATSERFITIAQGTSLTFSIRTTVGSVFGRAAEVSGWLEVAWDDAGEIAVEAGPRMHVECQVQSLKTGSDFQDRALWNMIDNKRFPKILGDLQMLTKSEKHGIYNARGRITLAGQARRYDGSLTVIRDGERTLIDGALDVDVRDFGLQEKEMLKLKVDPIVKVRLQMVALGAP